MNHCITCGRKVSAGRYHNVGANAVRCIICQVKKDFRGWKFETPVMKLRREAKEHA